MFAIFEDPLGVFEDLKEGDPALDEHQGPFRGIVIRPHKRSEPVRLDFTADSTLKPAFTKTQFAPFTIHMQVVALLRRIAPFMAEFAVLDEAGLWESGNVVAARQRFESLAATIDAFSAALGAKELEEEEWGGLPDLGDDSDDKTD